MKRFFRDALNAPPQNQLQLAECTCRKKSCMWAAMRPLLKVKLRCKDRLALRGWAAPQNQLHLRNCSRPKICVVGCEVLSGVASKAQLHHLLRIRSAAKSSKLHPPKNLHGGLRGATRGWCTKSLLKVRLRCKACHATQLRIRSSSIAPCKLLRLLQLCCGQTPQLRYRSAAKSIAVCKPLR